MDDMQIDAQEYERIDKVRTQVADELFALPNVVGLAVDKKVVDGKATERLCLVVFVIEKRDVVENQLVPRSIDGVDTDVQQGTFDLPDDADLTLSEEENRIAVDRRRYNPIKGGCSIGAVWTGTHKSILTAGTLGIVVTDRSTGVPLLLSNEHVLRPISNSADPAYQPAYMDVKNQNNKVGVLHRARRNRTIDAAVIKLDPSLSRRIAKREILNIGRIRGTAGIALGGTVMKRGRSTRLTHGVVIDRNFSCVTPRGHRFDGQFLIQEKNKGIFSKKGDSGSVVVALPHNPYAIGLLHAGFHKQSGETQGVANPIKEVARMMSINF